MSYYLSPVWVIAFMTIICNNGGEDGGADSASARRRIPSNPLSEKDKMMAVKTYVPTLLTIARLLLKYIGKYEATLKANLSGPQGELLDTLRNALSALISAVEVVWGL